MGRRKSRFFIRAIPLTLAKAILTALLFLSVVTMLAHADTGASARSPGDMSVDERLALMAFASTYDNCIYSKAMSHADEFPDIRHALDFALTACQNELAHLRNFLVEAGFTVDYSTAFSTITRNRAARKIFPELAIRRSRR